MVIGNRIGLSRNNFLLRCIVLSFLVVLITCYIDVAYSLNTAMMIICILICIIYTIVIMLIEDVREKIIASIDFISKVIGVAYACIWCALIIASISKNLNSILILFMPSIVIAIITYAFRKEIINSFKMSGIIFAFVYLTISFSLPLSFLIQVYSKYNLYRVFIAVLLIIVAIISLIISSDNIKNVVDNSKNRIWKENFLK